MKRHPEYLLREVADSIVIVPVGTASTAFPGMITLNAPGRFLWELLETEQTVESLTQAMTAEYDVTPEKAKEDIESFLARLRKTGALLEG